MQQAVHRRLYLLQKETITGDELMVYVNADAKSIPDHTGDEYYYNQQYHFCQQIFSYFF